MSRIKCLRWWKQKSSTPQVKIVIKCLAYKKLERRPFKNLLIVFPLGRVPSTFSMLKSVQINFQRAMRHCEPKGTHWTVYDGFLRVCLVVRFGVWERYCSKWLEWIILRHGIIGFEFAIRYVFWFWTGHCHCFNDVLGSANSWSFKQDACSQYPNRVCYHQWAWLTISVLEMFQCSWCRSFSI